MGVFVASYILGHLCGVKAQLSSLLAGHDCIVQTVPGTLNFPLRALVVGDGISHSARQFCAKYVLLYVFLTGFNPQGISIQCHPPHVNCDELMA